MSKVYAPLKKSEDTETVTDCHGLKYDDDKPRMDLIPPSVYKSLADVLTFGFKKYKKENSWQNVEIKRYHAALLRHLVSWIEDPLGKDEESGLYHSEHLRGMPWR